KALRDVGMRETVQLIVSGGIRSGADVAKAIALGADAVSIGMGALIALGLQSSTWQMPDGTVRDLTDDYAKLGTTAAAYHHMHTGYDPTGIATQDPELESRLDPEAGARRVANYLNAVNMELTTLARACGKSDVHNL